MVESNPTHNEKSYWKKPETYVSLATLLAVLTYTGVQIYQTHVISVSNTVSERAFVSISFQLGGPSYGGSAKTAWSVGDITNAIIEGAASNLVGYDIIGHLTNSGNTGTKALTFFMKCVPSTEQLQEPWSILYQSVNNPVQTPQYLGPHESTQTLCGFSGAQLRAMAAGKLFGYVMMDLKYQDRLVDDWHKTQATAVIAKVQFEPGIEPHTGLQGEIPKVYLAGYGRHNCADEECPE
jgi:hypothetical protein